MTHHVPVPIAHDPSLTLHLLVFIVTCAKMVGASSGVVEVDLIFPRNSTYAPTANLPIIFASQNFHLAPFLDPLIHISAQLVSNANGSTQRTPPDTAYLEQLRWANFTTNVDDIYFAYPTYQSRTFNFETKGIWEISWTLDWAVCTADSLARNQSKHTTTLTISKGAQEGDLVGGTADQSCEGQEGVAINVTDTLPVPDVLRWEGQGKMCASTADGVPKSEPCRVSINATAAASISCEIGLATFSACPEDKKSAAGKLTVGGLVALFAVLSYLLY